MSSECVEEASGWAKRLTMREARGPGDLENAWRRLEARYAIPWRTFWALRYRKPRGIEASIYARIQAAYQFECERQQRKLAIEIEITKAVAGPNHAAIRAASALVDETDTT